MELTNEIYNSIAIPIIPGSTVGTPSGIVGTFPGSGCSGSMLINFPQLLFTKLAAYT